jgi:hypothetical protein
VLIAGPTLAAKTKRREGGAPAKRFYEVNFHFGILALHVQSAVRTRLCSVRQYNPEINYVFDFTYSNLARHDAAYYYQKG